MTADLAIVGAGFAGLSAARRLLQLNPTAVVAVLEAGRIAQAASGRNSGFMIDLPHELTSDNHSGHGNDQAMISLNRHAIGFAREAVGEYRIGADFFDPVSKINGAANAETDALNHSYGRHLANIGEESERLDAQPSQASGANTYSVTRNGGLRLSEQDRMANRPAQGWAAIVALGGSPADISLCMEKTLP